MAPSRLPFRRRLVHTAVAGVLIGLGVGCSDKPTPVVTDVEPKQEALAKDSQGNAVESKTNVIAKAGIDAKYTQTFAQATITDDIPEGAQLPVDRTISGKGTGQLRLMVEEEWDKIELVSSETGKPIPYIATVATSMGDFQITLRPDLSPNHVRNFLALSKVGYYDGLRIDRIVHQVALDEQMMPKSHLDLIKAGCPLGIGEEGHGHIGYFMRPELSDEVHEEGTVGFWHEDSAESGGTRFYITLGAAPVLDKRFTIVGKVTSGLDIVKKVASSPVLGDTYPEVEWPKEPITIHKVSFSKP